MTHKPRQQQRALAKIERQAAAGSLGRVDDPVSLGPDRSITIDMGKLTPPSQVYDADCAWLEHQPGDVRLFFAKLSRDIPKTLRSRLELRYPPESLVRHFWKNSREFHSKMKEFAAKWPQNQTRDAIEPERMPATKEHSEWANFEAMAHAGTEAVIDFYTLPAAGIARFARGHGSAGLRLTPVVRVQLSIFELTRLLDTMEPVVAMIEAYLPSLEKPE